MSIETELETEYETEADIPNRRRFARPLAAVILFVLIGGGAAWYLNSLRFQETDDAQVDGHLNPIAARVDGTIRAIHVDDNSVVNAGQLLVELDPVDNQVALDQAKAQLDQALAQLGESHPNLPMTQISNRADQISQNAEVTNAEAALSAARHDLDSALAKLKESEATDEKDQGNFQRYQVLYDNKVVSRADYEQYRAAAASQSQAVAANKASVASAQKMVEQRAAQLTEQRERLDQTDRSAPLKLAIRTADIKSQEANREVAQASLEKAKLNLSYCSIAAPISGVVTQRSAEIGARVTAGQQLLMVVQTSDLWVTANFKETQLARIHPGQPVRIHVDALSRDFDGVVENLPAITGSRASVLPPENATGNYVKVVQRMPVRIRFNPNQKALDQLRPGMSAEPKVRLD
jgi:membrane fusion protein, multidrug efflux system